MNLIIIGAGGHGKVIADMIEKNKNNEAGIFSKECIVTFLDDSLPVGSIVAEHPVIGSIQDCEKYPDAHFVIAIGSNTVRREISERYDGLNFITLIHPTAVIGSGAKIECGTVIMANAVINADACIGRHCIVNTGAYVEHDNVISDYVHISPGAVLGGNVQVGENSWIGLGASVKNGVSITEDSVVGAGAVVVHDIQESGTYVGIPVRRVKSRENLGVKNGLNI